MPVVFKESNNTLYYKTGEEFKPLTGQLQTLSISGKNLILSSGNSVQLPDAELKDTGWLTPKKQLLNVYWRRRDKEPSARLYYRRIGSTVYFMIRGTYLGDIGGPSNGYQDDTFPEVEPNRSRNESVKQRRYVGWGLVCFKDVGHPDAGRAFPITGIRHANPDGSGTDYSRVPDGFRPIFPQEIKCRTEFQRSNGDANADKWIRDNGSSVSNGANIPNDLVKYYGGKFRYDKFDEMFGYFFISAKNDSNCVMQLRNFRNEENLSDLKFNGVSWTTDDSFPSESHINEVFYKVKDIDKNIIIKK